MLLAPFFLSLAIALLITPVIIRIANRFGFIDDPKTHKHPAIIHKKVIPRAGGLVLYLAIIIPILVFLPQTKQIIGIILGATLAVVIGTIDDKYDISPILRLISNFIVAAIAVAAGIGIGAITNPLGGIIQLDQLRLTINFLGQHNVLVFADILALFWIVWVMNMLNWSKGVDGQMPGIVVVASIVVALVSLKFLAVDPGQLLVAQIALIVAGASLGFLAYNFYPAKIFPGYGGTVLGFVIATLAILSSGKVATAVLVLAVPMIDGGLTIMRRLVTKKSPFRGDRSHLHHLLLDRGWSQRQIALFYWGLCAILGALALNLKSLEKLFVAVGLFIIAGGSILWINLVGRKESGN